MARLNKFLAMFKSSKSKNFSKKETPQGNAGFDNIRENIDPHVKTRVITTSELRLQDGTAAGFVKNTADGTISGGNTISETDLDLTALTQNVVAAVDNTYNLGSSAKRWGYLYAVIAVLSSIIIGNIILTNSAEGWLYVNASTLINGSLNVTQNVTAKYFLGNGSQLSGIAASGSSNCSVSNSCAEIVYSNNKTTVKLNTSNVGNLNITGNFTLQENYTMCFNKACNAYQKYNGSALIIKVT